MKLTPDTVVHVLRLQTNSVEERTLGDVAANYNVRLSEFTDMEVYTERTEAENAAHCRTLKAQVQAAVSNLAACEVERVHRFLGKIKEEQR